VQSQGALFDLEHEDRLGPVAAYAGLDQVNISIPKSLAGTGDVRMYVVADGVASNVVGLSIQ